MYESFRNGPEIAEVLGRIHNRTGIPLDSAGNCVINKAS